MWPDQVSHPGPLALESDVQPTGLHGLAIDAGNDKLYGYVCGVLHAHVQFCLFDKADATTNIQSPTTSLIPLFSSSEHTGCRYPVLSDWTNCSEMCCQWESNPLLPA